MIFLEMRSNCEILPRHGKMRNISVVENNASNFSAVRECLAADHAN